jgi:hypothetical protein
MTIEDISYVEKDRDGKSLNYTELFVAAKSYPWDSEELQPIHTVY